MSKAFSSSIISTTTTTTAADANSSNNNATTTSTTTTTTTNDRIEWSRSTILDFIEDYHSQRVLWDPNTKGYHIKQTKYEALKALGTKYGTEIRSIRSKIKSLRSSFHREHGKVINGRRKGIHYQPMWFAYEAIRFILDGERSTPTLTHQQQHQLQKVVEESNVDEADGDDGDGDGDGDEEMETNITQTKTTTAIAKTTMKEEKLSNGNSRSCRSSGEAATSTSTVIDENVAESGEDLNAAAAVETTNERSVYLRRGGKSDKVNSGAAGTEDELKFETLLSIKPTTSKKAATAATTTTTTTAKALIMTTLPSSSAATLLRATTNSCGVRVVGAVGNENGIDGDTADVDADDENDNNIVARFAAAVAAVAAGAGLNVGGGVGGGVAGVRCISDEFAAAALAADVVHQSRSSSNNNNNNNLDNDGEYCTIRAEDVKTEIIESDMPDLAMCDRPLRAYLTPSPLNYFKPMEQQQQQLLQQPQQQHQQQQLLQTLTGSRKRKSYHLHHNTMNNDEAAMSAKRQQQQHQQQQQQLQLQQQYQQQYQQQLQQQLQLQQHSTSKQRELLSPATANNSTAALGTGTATISTATATNSNNHHQINTNNNTPPKSTQFTSSHHHHQHQANNDEYGVFGEYVAITIRKLKTSKAKIVVKHLINNLLYEAELGKYDHGIPASKEPPQLYKM